METRTIETPWSSIFTWDDITTLTVCLVLDLLDLLIPMMGAPIYGDILDFAGIAFCVLYFNWVGLITILEIIPGLDIIPFYSITWLTWYLNTSRTRRKKLEQQLENWK